MTIPEPPWGEESSFARAIWAEGYRKGWIEGLRKGELREARMALIWAGMADLGPPGSSVREAIDAIHDREAIDALVDRLPGAASWAELLAPGSGTPPASPEETSP